MRDILKISSLTVLLLGTALVAEAGWEEGVQAFKSRNYQQAVQEFKAVVDSKPEFAGGHYMLGQSYMAAGDKANALTHFRKAYELEPGKVTHQFLLGKAYLDNRRYSEALQVMKKIDPSSLPKKQQDTYQQMMAVALDKSGRSEEALVALRQVAQNNPNNDAAWFAYGTASLKAGHIDQAISALEKSTNLNGRDPAQVEIYAKALIQKARVTRDSSRKKAVYAKGASVAERLVANSASHENLLLLGELQLGAGDYGAAASTLQQAASKDGNDFYTHFYLAQAQTSLERWSQAEQHARRALELARSERDKKRVWTQIGFINEKMKNYEDAKVAYRNAGNQVGVRRVEENQRIAEENQEIEQHNEEIEQLQREREELEKQLEELEGGEPPLR